jgi:hypothetical protein
MSGSKWRLSCAYLEAGAAEGLLVTVTREPSADPINLVRSRIVRIIGAPRRQLRLKVRQLVSRQMTEEPPDRFLHVGERPRGRVIRVRHLPSMPDRRLSR